MTPGVAGLQGSLAGWGHRMSCPFPSPTAAPPYPEPGPVLGPFPRAVLPSPGSGAVLQRAASTGTGLGRGTTPLPPPAHGSGGERG